LLTGLVNYYILVPSNVKKVMRKEATGLIRSIGMNSPDLLKVFSQTFPEESNTFILTFLHVLTGENQNPSDELVSVVKKMYFRTKDARFLIPIIPGLSSNETIEFLPQLITLAPVFVKRVIDGILHHKPSPLSPQELFIALHHINTEDVNLLKLIIQAMGLCFDDPTVNQEVLAIVLQQLADSNSIPPLFMRTVIETVKKYKNMNGFILTILKRLIVKKIWKHEKLWIGFIKCCELTLPQSAEVLIQIPPKQLNDILSKNPIFLKPLFQAMEEDKTSINPKIISVLSNYKQQKVST